MLMDKDKCITLLKLVAYCMKNRYHHKGLNSNKSMLLLPVVSCVTYCSLTLHLQWCVISCFVAVHMNICDCTTLGSRTFCLPLYTVLWTCVLSLSTSSPSCWLYDYWVSSEPCVMEQSDRDPIAKKITQKDTFAPLASISCLEVLTIDTKPIILMNHKNLYKTDFMKTALYLKMA